MSPKAAEAARNHARLGAPAGTGSAALLLNLLPIIWFWPDCRTAAECRLHHLAGYAPVDHRRRQRLSGLPDHAGDSAVLSPRPGHRRCGCRNARRACALAQQMAAHRAGHRRASLTRSFRSARSWACPPSGAKAVTRILVLVAPYRACHDDLAEPQSGRPAGSGASRMRTVVLVSLAPAAGVGLALSGAVLHSGDLGGLGRRRARRLWRIAAGGACISWPR